MITTTFTCDRCGKVVVPPTPSEYGFKPLLQVEIRVEDSSIYRRTPMYVALSAEWCSECISKANGRWKPPPNDTAPAPAPLSIEDYIREIAREAVQENS